MTTQQAVEFVNLVNNSAYREEDLEIAHLAVIEAHGTQLEKMLKPGESLFSAMAAYMITPEGDMLKRAARNAAILFEQMENIADKLDPSL